MEFCSRCQQAAEWQPVLEAWPEGAPVPIRLKPKYCVAHRNELMKTWREYWGEERLRAKVRDTVGDIGPFELKLKWEPYVGQ